MPTAPVVVARGLGVKFNLRMTRRRTLRRYLAEVWRDPRGHRKSEFWALRDVDLDIYTGESLAILGRNGSGKSTLLTAIAGVIGVDSGWVSTFGHRATLLTIGAGFEPELSGRENIYLNGAYLRLRQKEIDRLLEPIIEFSELGDFIDAPVKGYSTGMRARLGFSIAAHTNPEILLLDEVLSVGDTSFQAKSRDRLIELTAQAHAVVVVSHSLDFILETCTRAVWLESGRVHRVGPVDEVVEEYAAASAVAAPIAPAADGPHPASPEHDPPLAREASG
jgi:lipopolysaccharide transport system ATP-binding protein